MKTRAIFGLTISAFTLSSCSFGNGITLNDLIRLGFSYADSEECTCENSKLATLSSGYDSAFKIKYETTTSSPNEPVTSTETEVVLAAKSSIPVGCTIGNRTDPILNPNPTPGQQQCTRRSVYTVKDTSRFRASSFQASLTSLGQSEMKFSMSDDDTNLAFCAQACTSGDIFNCLPLGSGFGPAREAISDLYDSALSNSHDEIPAGTAMSALGISQGEVPTQCQRGDTLILSDNSVVNEALIPSNDNWACTIPSNGMESKGLIKSASSTPAFTVRVPNRFEGAISPVASFATTKSGVTSIDQSRVVRSPALDHALVLDFGAEEFTKISAQNVPLYGGPVRAMFEIENLLIMETYNGCVSLQR